MHTWTAKNWMQCSASHVATTTLLLSQNGLRSNLRAPNLKKKMHWGSMPPDPPSLSCLCMYTYTSYIHVTPLLKILATGLTIVISKAKICISFSANSMSRKMLASLKADQSTTFAILSQCVHDT